MGEIKGTTEESKAAQSTTEESKATQSTTENIDVVCKKTNKGLNNFIMIMVGVILGIALSFAVFSSALNDAANQMKSGATAKTAATESVSK